jgi:hypothetical protein
MILFSFPREIIACRFSSERADKKNLKPGLPLFVLLRLRLQTRLGLGIEMPLASLSAAITMMPRPATMKNLLRALKGFRYL